MVRITTPYSAIRNLQYWNVQRADRIEFNDRLCDQSKKRSFQERQPQNVVSYDIFCGGDQLIPYQIKRIVIGDFPNSRRIFEYNKCSTYEQEMLCRGHTFPSKRFLQTNFSALGVEHEIVSGKFDVPSLTGLRLYLWVVRLTSHS